MNREQESEREELLLVKNVLMTVSVHETSSSRRRRSRRKKVKIEYKRAKLSSRSFEKRRRLAIISHIFGGSYRHINENALGKEE